MIKILNRTCSDCGTDKVEKFNKRVLRIDGKFEHIYEERCAFCRGLLYARIKTEAS